MEIVRNFFAEYPFAICVFVMVTCEIVKHLYEKRFRLTTWFAHGGMPSSHSAFVTSLMMVVGNIDGVRSGTFAVATVLSGIVWYDAAFVRNQVGKQARALNLLQELEQFSERVGHSVAEVIGGIFYGGAVTYVVLSFVS